MEHMWQRQELLKVILLIYIKTVSFIITSAPFEMIKIVCFVSILILLFPLTVHCQWVKGNVLSVQDGDSFKLLTPDSIYNIRLNGIDCPEINQNFGEEARDFLSRYSSKEVTAVLVDIDRYGRSIADVFYRDTLINLQLIKHGLAWHYKKYSTDPLLASNEDLAKNNKIGLWGKENPIAPWDWRHGNFDHSIFKENQDTKVFICIGSENNTYHRVHFCDSLKTCNSTIIIVFPSEAINVYHKLKCSICIN